MTGIGRSYKEQQWERVNCPECGKDLARGSLVAHRQKQHGVAMGRPGQEGNIEDGGDKTRDYRMVFPTKAGLISCPVEWYSVQAATRTSMRMHFWHWHIWYTVVILEDVNPPPHGDLYTICWCHGGP